LPTSARSPLPRTDPIEPPSLALTRAERQVIDRLRSPLAVQQWLNALPYNTEKGGETLRSFRGVIAPARRTASRRRYRRRRSWSSTATRRWS
jgi:hypothetical protein